VVVAYRPDVAYVLAQYAIQLEQSLLEAEEEIKRLEQKVISACASRVTDSPLRFTAELKEPQHGPRLKRAALSQSN